MCTEIFKKEIKKLIRHLGLMHKEAFPKTHTKESFSLEMLHEERILSGKLEKC